MAVNGGHGVVDMGENSQISVTSFDYRNDDDNKKVQISYTLRERIGLDELFSPDVLRGALAELIGSAVMIFMMDTIAISTVESHIPMPHLVFSFLMGTVLGIVLLTLFPISGGHANPVITLSAALLGLISLSRALMYLLAQCIGCTLGALALKAVVSTAIADKFNLGGCSILEIEVGPNGPITIGLDVAQAFWIETFCTFSLLVTALGIGFHPRLMKTLGHAVVFSIIGIVVAILIYVSTSVTGQKGYTGAGLNPARCFGAALVKGGQLWHGHWVFWAGPTIACFVFYFYTKALSDEEYHVRGHKYDFVEVMKAALIRA